MIILLSGKCFTGKDTVAKHVPELKRVSIADHMKLCYMEENPDVDMFDRKQKEQHRIKMEKFISSKSPEYWLEQTPFQNDCIVTDIRTILEINYVIGKFGKDSVKTVRLEVCDDERKKRGWVFKKGYDDTNLETELDDYDFDLILMNESDEDLENCVKQIRKLIQ